MIHNWYRLFNLTEWLATGLVSRTLVLDLEVFGTKTFLITQGETTSVTVDDVMLSLNMGGLNPFRFEGYAVYLHPDTQDVWLDIETTDET